MPDAPIPPEMQRPGVRWESAPTGKAVRVGCLLYIWAALGSIVLGVTLPVFLVGLHIYIKPQPGANNPFEDFFWMSAAACVLCSPPAVILSSVLLLLLAQSKEERTLQQTVKAGALRGSAMAFLNLPGYFSVFMMKDDALALPRMMLLFVVAGSSCGVWIAWQAWRARNPGERTLPRFSLQTLLLIVFLWAGVMVAFQPERRPQDHVVAPESMP